jgi:DNA-binding transcriptional ArsR family regulator
VLLLVAARRLLAVMPRRGLTVRDIEVYDDPWRQRLLRGLPATADDLAAATGQPAAEVAATLDSLAEDGYVRRRRDGRWHELPQYLREPRPDEFAEPHRSRVAAYLDEKYDEEVRLLAWAATHRDEFGPWGKAQRASARLTVSELREFEVAYLELLTRFCQLRRDPVPGVRKVAVRFYAFPPPSTPIP